MARSAVEPNEIFIFISKPKYTMFNKEFLSLNRALIKRVDLLPNVSEFNTQRLGVHEYAAMYGVEKIRRSTEVIKLHKGQPNRYLERVAYTLSKYGMESKVSEYNKLSETVQRKSIAFRVLALNRTMDSWFTLPIKKLDKIWRSLSSICRTNSSKVEFKRVWIDKKPGDYARPLGVPTPAWRCWSYMKMDHLERFYKASGALAPWQHGGRSGVGVLSCYKQLIPRITTENTIYEFDIKGFFDNIKHDVIIQRIKETLYTPMSRWVEGVLNSKPTKYTLPPIEEDLAVKTLMNKPLYSPAAGIQELVYDDYNLWRVPEEEFKVISSAEADRLMKEEGYQIGNPLDIDSFGSFIDDDGQFGLFQEVGGDQPLFTPEMNIKEDYKEAMTGKVIDTMVMEPFLTRSFNKEFTEQDRAQGRDSWKDLGQEGRGVPQGLGTSPFLSTFMTDLTLNNLKDNIIMYMDDGILFARNKAEMEKLISILKGCLDSIGLEIAPEKSKYVKIDGKWVESLKFLGLRYLPEEDCFMSDTRSGTKIKFPSLVNWSDFKALAEVNFSNEYAFKAKFDKMINTTAYEAGLKYGFLGCLIAESQYKDQKSMEERREDISRGQSAAWAKIEHSKGFIWKFQDLHSYTEYLTNVSSIQVHKFMKLNSKGGKLYQYQGRKHRRELLK